MATPRRILIVDDEDDIREVAQVSLELLGQYEVLTASCGRDGVASARTGQPDAILLDVDNGPEGLIRKANDALYDAKGLKAIRRALRPGGVLAVWSSGPNPLFSKRLRAAGFEVNEMAVRATAKRSGARHVIWFATKL